MLGVSFLFSITLQHFLGVGLFVLTLGHMLSGGSGGLQQRKNGLVLTILGLSLINLSFLYFVFTDELLLIQTLLCFFYTLLLFLKIPESFFQKQSSAKTSVAFLILITLLSVELLV